MVKTEMNNDENFGMMYGIDLFHPPIIWDVY